MIDIGRELLQWIVYEQTHAVWLFAGGWMRFGEINARFENAGVDCGRLAERIDIRRAAMRSGFLLRREWFVFEKI
jgi:hypothetical protein